MKTSSGGQGRPPLDRSRAWLCLVTNLLVLPGAGSLMAGRWSGFAQMALALTGFGITLIAVIRFGLFWFGEGDLDDGERLRLWMLCGLSTFAAGWLWSLSSGLSILRKASENKSPDEQV